MKDLLIIKIGGNIVDDERALHGFIAQFMELKMPRLLVHGGGKLATRLGEQLGVPVVMKEGRRVTCAETLKITTMVYAGLINKSITALINARGGKAIGLCGADLSIIPSKKRPVGETDYGLVGDVLTSQINTASIQWMLEAGVIPVIAPITADAEGQLLNTNADTVASALAVALSSSYKVNLVYGFEKDGVMNGDGVVRRMDRQLYSDLKAGKVITDGMIPKLDNAFSALASGVSNITIGRAEKLGQLISQHEGTHISR